MKHYRKGHGYPNGWEIIRAFILIIITIPLWPFFWLYNKLTGGYVGEDIYYYFHPEKERPKNYKPENKPEN